MPLKRGKKPKPPAPALPDEGEVKAQQCMRCNAIMKSPFANTDARGEQVNYVDETGAYEHEIDLLDAGRDKSRMLDVSHRMCKSCNDELDAITDHENGMTTEERRQALIDYSERTASVQQRAIERSRAKDRELEERRLRQTGAETERQQQEQGQEQVETEGGTGS